METTPRYAAHSLVRWRNFPRPAILEDLLSNFPRPAILEDLQSNFPRTAILEDLQSNVSHQVVLKDLQINFPRQDVVEDLPINSPQLNLRRSKTLARLDDKRLVTVRRRLQREDKENIFDNFNCPNRSIIELESLKRVETLKRDECISRPVLYPRSSSRKRLRNSPTKIIIKDHDNYISKIDFRLLDTSRVFNENKQLITCSGSNDIILKKGNNMMGFPPNFLDATKESIVTAEDSCYFSPITPLSETRSTDISIIEAMELDNRNVCEDITNVSAISDGSVISVHEQVSVTHANEEAVFCSTFSYPLHSTVLNSPGNNKKNDSINLTTLVDSSLEGDEGSSETSGSSESDGLSQSPLSLCIEELEQVDLTNNENKRDSVNRQLLKLPHRPTGRCAPIVGESWSRIKQLHLRASVLDREVLSAEAVDIIVSKEPRTIFVPDKPQQVNTDLDAIYDIHKRLTTDGKSIERDDRFIGRRLKRQTGNTALNRRQLIKPQTIVCSSTDNQSVINESTVDSTNSSRSTLFASNDRLMNIDTYPRRINGDEVDLRDVSSDASIDVDLPHHGSSLLSTENILRSRVSSYRDTLDYRPRGSGRLSVITEGSIEGVGQSSRTISKDHSTRKYCKKTSSNPKYRRNEKNKPYVKTHCRYCLEQRMEVRHSQVTQMPKHHRLGREVVVKPNDDEVHKCLAVDSMQLGRRKVLARKFQHLRRALHSGGSDGYTRLTTMGQL